MKNHNLQGITLPTRTYVSVANIMKLLEFVLKNSYFTYKQEDHYQQTLGCAMGSPVSATIANLMMEFVEETAISTAAHPPWWLCRYVNDSHTCVKKDYMEELYSRLNSVEHKVY